MHDVMGTVHVDSAMPMKVIALVVMPMQVVPAMAQVVLAVMPGDMACVMPHMVLTVRTGPVLVMHVHTAVRVMDRTVPLRTLPVCRERRLHPLVVRLSRVGIPVMRNRMLVDNTLSRLVVLDMRLRIRLVGANVLDVAVV